MIDVVLTDEQLRLALYVANMRQDAALQKERPSAHGYTEDDPMAVHYLGCVTELGTAWYLKRPWHAYIENLNRFGGKKPPDVGDNTQVRGIDNSRLCLIAHDTDADEDVFVSALWLPPRTVRLRGWLYGRECKRRTHWRDDEGVRTPAYFVKAKYLTAMPSVITCDDFSVEIETLV